MSRKLFGTDGIRGVAGEYPLDRKTARAVGSALGQWILAKQGETAVVIGMDTRESGPWLAAEMAAGLAQHGVTLEFAGITTTPGVAYLAKTGPFAAGVMISASHNPYQDNGIKIIDHSGYKLADEVELCLEEEIFRLLADSASSPEPTAPLTVDEQLDETYIEHLAGTVNARFDGITIALDCANGSAAHLAPQLFERLGAKLILTGCAPDGRNINLDCGSLHLESLRKTVLASGADLGVAFDGDADRALFVSHSGKIIDGDAVMLMCARRMHAPVVVGTVMSNLGFERTLAKDGIRLVRTPVGDKYVLEEMLRIGALIGGEQSGHVIFRAYATTGDGMLTALRVLDVMTASGQDLDRLTADLEIYPQLLVNVRVKNRRPLADLPGVQHEIKAAEDSFGEAGRVLVRFSGTEPLARVMVEGPDLDRVKTFAGRIASQIQEELGAE
jgi:phosphoglucosamine mutase